MHCSTTDPEAMLARKGPGKEAKLSYHGHLMTENRSGLVMKTLGMLRQLRHRGLERVGWVFTLAAATYNLVRMRTLMLKCAYKERSSQNHRTFGRSQSKILESGNPNRWKSR